MNYNQIARAINPENLNLEPLRVNTSKTMKCYYSPAYKNVARVPYALYVARLFPKKMGNR